MMEAIAQFINNTGLPVALVIYFVVRGEKIINNNTKALTLFLDRIKK